MISIRPSSLILALASIALAWPTSVAAQEAQGGESARPFDPYVEYQAGVTFVPNQTLKGADVTGSTLMGSSRHQEGYMVGGAIGARFLDLLRSEIAVNFRESDVENVGVTSGDTSADGEFSLLTVMTNVYVEYELDYGIVPFAGFGIGYGRLSYDTESVQVQIGDRASVFAYNAMVGAPTRSARSPT